MDDSEGNVALVNDSHFKKPQGCRSIVEILMFMFFFAKTLSDTVVVNLLEKSTCLVILNYDDANCTDPMSPTTEGVLQQNTATLLMARSMIEAIIPSLLALFIGPWSDTNGRRPLMLLSLTGYTVSVSMWCGLSLIPGLHPMYYLLTCIPVALGAGYTSFFLAVYCYISDITEFNKRAFRMGLLMTCCLGGVLMGSLVTPYLLQTSVRYGYTIVFGTSASLLFISLLFSCAFVQETVNVVESERTKLWKLDHVKEIFTTCFKERAGHVRTIVMFMTIDLMIFIVIMEGELAQMYMFTQKTFHWSLKEYTRYAAFAIFLAGSSSLGCTWFFSNVLKLADLPITFLGTVSMLTKAILQATATTSEAFYIATSFSVLSVLISPLTRSQLSKLVPAEDLGKIFAFMAFMEATSPVAAAPLYTFVYKATMDTLPNAIFWLSAGLSVISVLLIGTSIILHRRSVLAGFTLVHNDDEDVGTGNSIQS